MERNVAPAQFSLPPHSQLGTGRGAAGTSLVSGRCGVCISRTSSSLAHSGPGAAPDLLPGCTAELRLSLLSARGRSWLRDPGARKFSAPRGIRGAVWAWSSCLARLPHTRPGEIVSGNLRSLSFRHISPAIVRGA